MKRCILRMLIGFVTLTGAAGAWEIAPQFRMDARAGLFDRPVIGGAAQFGVGAFTLEPRLSGGWYSPPAEDTVFVVTEEHYNYVAASLNGRRPLGAGGFTPWLGWRCDFIRSDTKIDRDSFYTNVNTDEQHDDYTTVAGRPYAAAGIVLRDRKGGAEIVLGAGVGPGVTLRYGRRFRDNTVFGAVLERANELYDGEAVTTLEGCLAGTLNIRMGRHIGFRADLEGYGRLANISGEPYEPEGAGFAFAFGPSFAF